MAPDLHPPLPAAAAAREFSKNIKSSDIWTGSIGSLAASAVKTNSQADVEQLAARISAHPVDYVAQEHVLSRSAPVLLDNREQARRFVVRAYLTAADGSYTVMPGGLTRVTESQDSLVVSLQKGGGSKDTWIVDTSADYAIARS